VPPAPLELVVRREPGAFELRRLDPGATWLQMRPRPRGALLQECAGGWVLTGPDRKVYLRLGPEERHLWGLIDGRATVAEIATAYFITFGSLPVSRVAGFIHALRGAGLVEVEPAGFLRRRFAHVSWLRRELTWDGAHPVAAAVWRVVGPLATPWNLPVAAAICALGAHAAWIDDRVVAGGLAARLPLLAVALVVHVALHELAHAVAVVGFGRRVRGVAIGLRGVYVDTTDMYLGTREQHAVVALAGPGATLLFAALASVVACALPAGLAAAPREFATVGWGLALFTGWPFLFDNDGAHAFGDLTRTANPRFETWHALRTGRVRHVHLVYLIGSIATVLAFPLWLLAGG
jgi:hypothetical protein